MYQANKLYSCLKNVFDGVKNCTNLASEQNTLESNVTNQNWQIYTKSLPKQLLEQSLIIIIIKFIIIIKMSFNVLLQN